MSLKSKSILKDALYNCHPLSGSIEYARGVMAGLMCGLMANDVSFEYSLKLLWNYTQEGISDLEMHHVRACLPDSWLEMWDSFKLGGNNVKSIF
jgi:hypothetical protein